MENLMRETFIKRSGYEYEALKLAHLTWIIYDAMFYTDRAKIFQNLYMTSTRSQSTYIKKSLDLNVNIRTLERYRKYFVKSFKVALTLINNINLFDIT